LTYFLCIGIKDDAVDTLSSLDRFQLEDKTTKPIGRATLGFSGRGRAFLVLSRGDSTDIVQPYRKYARTQDEFLRSIESILALRPSLYLICHHFRGWIDTEEIEIKGEKKIQVSEFVSQFSGIEDDVRYVILGNPAQ
jgi:hypothetical protein